MAGASMNGIKSRIKSVESTMQITKAMELVATSKLRRLKEMAESSRPYVCLLREAMDDCIAGGDTSGLIWTSENGAEKDLFIVIAGDRGLAGGYNSNVFKLTNQLSCDTHPTFIPIGRKANEHYRRREAEIFTDGHESAAEMDVGDCMSLGKTICDGFAAGNVGKVFVVYTEFTSMMTQTPKYMQILPLATSGEKNSADGGEALGDAEEILSHIIPIYTAGVIWSALCESLAAECGARRSAMNAANKNAGEMIDSLMLKFNRARQAVITQEITEIVSGAEAL